MRTKMNSKLYYYEFFSMLFVILVGSILNFSYDWSGNNVIVAAFSGVNESVWEHLKTFFFPYVLFGLFEYFKLGKMYSNLIACKTAGVLAGMAFIVTAFFTYTGVLGYSVFIVDILLFVLAAALASFTSYRLIVGGSLSGGGARILAIFIILLFASAFVVFTFIPPHINLFSDPLTGKYGISVNS